MMEQLIWEYINGDLPEQDLDHLFLHFLDNPEVFYSVERILELFKNQSERIQLN